MSCWKLLVLWCCTNLSHSKLFYFTRNVILTLKSPSAMVRILIIMKWKWYLINSGHDLDLICLENVFKKKNGFKAYLSVHCLFHSKAQWFIMMCPGPLSPLETYLLLCKEALSLSSAVEHWTLNKSETLQRYLFFNKYWMWSFLLGLNGAFNEVWHVALIIEQMRRFNESCIKKDIRRRPLLFKERIYLTLETEASSIL